MYAAYLAAGSELLAEGIEEFSEARELADTKAKEDGVEVLVKHSETDVVAYVTSVKAIAKQETGEWFTPWTRLESPKFAAPVFEDYVPAYTRKRIQATVYRRVSEKGWRVHDGRTGNYRDVENTKQACALTSEMRQGLEL